MCKWSPEWGRVSISLSPDADDALTSNKKRRIQVLQLKLTSEITCRGDNMHFVKTMNYLTGIFLYRLTIFVKACCLLLILLTLADTIDDTQLDSPTARLSFDDDCNITHLWQHIKIPRFSRKATKSGFHREIQTTVDDLLGNDESLHSDLASLSSCYFMLKETIPKGMYVDPYELQSLSDSSTSEALHYKFYVPDYVDVEQPAYRVPPDTLTVYIYFSIRNCSAIKISMPVHLRYHLPNKLRHRSPDILLQNPILYAPGYISSRRTIEAPCGKITSQLCIWSEGWNFQQPLFNGSDISFSVPVGEANLTEWVTLMTSLVTLLGCVAIIFTIHSKPMMHRHQD